jgi:hypothetical protein
MPKTRNATTAAAVPTQLSTDEIERLLESIALDHLFIETLVTQHSDRLDSHEVSVWAVRTALRAAYQAGQRARCEVHCVQHSDTPPSQSRRIRVARAAAAN